MNERTVAEALAEWFREDIEIESAYAYPISNAEGPLPDVVVLCSQKEVSDRPPDELTGMGLEQVWARIFTIEATIMVAVAGQTENQADAADTTLRAFGAAIETSVFEDPTLGERLGVGACSPRMRFDYSTPFIERADGTRGRFSVVELTVVEPIAAPS